MRASTWSCGVDSVVAVLIESSKVCCDWLN